MAPAQRGESVRRLASTEPSVVTSGEISAPSRASRRAAAVSGMIFPATLALAIASAAACHAASARRATAAGPPACSGRSALKNCGSENGPDGHQR